MNRTTAKWASALGVLATALLSSVVHASAASAASFSTQDLLDGVFFETGPVAKIIASGPLPSNAQKLATIHAIEHRMLLVDPKLQTAFAADIASGDPIRVSNAIDEASRDLHRVTTTFSQHGASSFSEGDIVVEVDTATTTTTTTTTSVKPFPVAGPIQVLNSHVQVNPAFAHTGTSFIREHVIAQIVSQLAHS
jgi:hypothetical protein